MAVQKGPLYFSGTLAGVTFYRMGQGYYARKKSSLNRQRFLADPAFARSRAAAALFGTAARLAADVYRLLPQEKKGHGVIGRLSGAANQLLHLGKSKEEVLVILLQQYAGIDITPKAKEAVDAQPHRLYTPKDLLPKLSVIHSCTEQLFFSNNVKLFGVAAMAPT